MTNNLELTLIAAYSLPHRVIGNENNLPWSKIKEDMYRFRQLTIGSPVIMGRATFDSLKNKALNRRTNVVVSSQDDLIISSGTVYHAFNLDEAFEMASNFRRRAFVIGGENLYEQTINHRLTTGLEITEIHSEYLGDKHFPFIDRKSWQEVERDKREGFDFVRYTRK